MQLHVTFVFLLEQCDNTNSLPNAQTAGREITLKAEQRNRGSPARKCKDVTAEAYPLQMFPANAFQNLSLIHYYMRKKCMCSQDD